MNIRKLRTAGPIALAAGLWLAASALAADELPTIIIGAGVMTKTEIGRSTLGATVEKVTITHRVSYSDLDLSTQAGATELKRRVSETARAACRQLHELYPLEANDARACAKLALADASPQVESAIAAASKQAKTE